MRGGRRTIKIAGAGAGYVLACRLWPGFARAARNRLSLPAMALLHRWTAPLPFPLAEALALGLGVSALGALAGALGRFVACGKGLGRWARGVARVAAVLGAALALLWAPVLAQPVEGVPPPDAEQLAWLCETLIGQLNASPLAFPDAGTALALAPGVAGLEGRTVKAARYPEWMRAAHVCGLFVPLTGEAVVDASAPAALIPFTAVHELAHLAGIGDEGAANVAAWERCLEAGGPFADSARLWALRYAAGLLRPVHEAAWRRASDGMGDALRQVFWDCGGEAAAGPRGLSLARGDYAALAGYAAGLGGGDGAAGMGRIEPLTGK